MASTAVPVLSVPAGVARALLEGEQLIDVRLASGGAPPAGATRFWLRPETDADDADLKPAYRLARRLSTPEDAPPAGRVRIEGWAELVGTARTTLDAERTDALASKTVLDLARLAERAGGDDVLVLALRAHRLVEPLTVAGTLEGLPADPGTAASEPALSDVAFEAKLDGVAEGLPGGFTPAGG